MSDSSSPLKIVFMGTPSFAIPALDALLRAGNDVVGVFTKPDRRSGRGRRLHPTPVRAFAEERGLSVFTPKSLRGDRAAQAQIAALAPDAIVVVAYGLFLPPAILAAPRLGCLNIHPSLLPRYRGPSPVVSAILRGDNMTGVTIMLLDEGMDTGPVLAQVGTRIGATETAESLTSRLFEMGAELLAETLPDWSAGRIQPKSQDERAATVTRLLRREDGLLDWTRGADCIERRIRAFDPWPGAYTRWRGQTLKILRAAPSDAGSNTSAGDESTMAKPPGTVVRLPLSGIGVVTGAGVLEILSVQLEGRRASSVEDFARGQQDFIGSALGKETAL